MEYLCIIDLLEVYNYVTFISLVKHTLYQKLLIKRFWTRNKIKCAMFLTFKAYGQFKIITFMFIDIVDRHLESFPYDLFFIY